MPNSTPAGTHAAGQNVKAPDGTVYFISKGGQRRAYTSAGAFLSYKFNKWADVQTANSQDLQLALGDPVPPRDGSIICSDRGADRGTCYVISEGAVAGFPSKEVFFAQGYKFENVLSGDVSFLQQKPVIQNAFDQHAPGSWIDSSGTVYLVTPQGLSGVSSPQIMEAWGVGFPDVLPATAGDKALASGSSVPLKLDGELNPLSDLANLLTPASYNFSQFKILQGGPDFTITDIISDPAQPVANQPFLLTFSIKNVGQSAGIRPRYSFLHTPKADQATLAKASCFRDTNLQPSQSCTDSWLLVFNQPGPVELNFIANTGDENGNFAQEADYNNNKTTYNFTVLAASAQTPAVQLAIVSNPSVEVGQFYNGGIAVRAALADLNTNYLSFFVTSGSLPKGLVIASECDPQKPRTSNYLICAIVIAGNPAQSGSFPLQITGKAPSGETASISMAVNVSASSATSTPAQFVLDYPKGGEQFQHGQLVPLAWTGGNSNTVAQFTLMRQWMANEIPEPSSPDPFSDLSIKNTTATGGVYNWVINPSLPPGQYFLYGCLSNAINTSNCLATDAIKLPIAITQAVSVVPYNDKQRLVDTLTFAIALESYFNDRNSYPDNLSILVPGYLQKIPVAPNPPDGSCTVSQNTYGYSKLSSTEYTLNFCLGSNAQNYTAGPHILSPAGIR